MNQGLKEISTFDHSEITMQILTDLGADQNLF